MGWDRAAGSTWRAARVVVPLVAAGLAAVLLGACSTVVGFAGGAPPVRASAGLRGPTGTEPFYGAVGERFGIAMTWLTLPDDSLYVSVYFTPVDPFGHDGGQQTFTASAARPGSEVTLTGVPARRGDPPPPPAKARFSSDGRSVLLSVPGRAPVTLARMSPARFKALMSRARYAAPPGTAPETDRSTGSR